MKASEFIAELQALIDAHGDLGVIADDDSFGHRAATGPSIYDADGKPAIFLG